jgi:hypothetical protein
MISSRAADSSFPSLVSVSSSRKPAEKKLLPRGPGTRGAGSIDWVVLSENNSQNNKRSHKVWQDSDKKASYLQYVLSK